MRYPGHARGSTSSVENLQAIHLLLCSMQPQASRRRDHDHAHLSTRVALGELDAWHGVPLAFG